MLAASTEQLTFRTAYSVRQDCVALRTPNDCHMCPLNLQSDVTKYLRANVEEARKLVASAKMSQSVIQMMMMMTMVAVLAASGEQLPLRTA